MTPIISVIIPTANRPHYLPRSINSALKGMKHGEVEVIVVPNGPDESWRAVLEPYQNNTCVRVIRIKEANANIARNAGLNAARGHLVRFLDDDDYLVPEGAIKQYELIQDSSIDVISGSVQLVDEEGRCFRTWRQPDVDDICAAMLGPSRVCHPSAHVYKRSKLKNLQWNPETSVRQDFEWLFDLCASTELSWKKIDDVVGAWQHHWENRISSSIDYNTIRKLTVPMIMRTYEILKKDGRLTEARKRAISQGLWGCIQVSFFLQPLYWTQVASVAQKIDPTARPVRKIYNYPVIRRFNPLLIHYVMLPKRLFYFYLRRLLNKFRLRHNW